MYIILGNVAEPLVWSSMRLNSMLTTGLQSEIEVGSGTNAVQTQGGASDSSPLYLSYLSSIVNIPAVAIDTASKESNPTIFKACANLEDNSPSLDSASTGQSVQCDSTRRLISSPESPTAPVVCPKSIGENQSLRRKAGDSHSNSRLVCSTSLRPESPERPKDPKANKHGAMCSINPTGGLDESSRPLSNQLISSSYQTENISCEPPMDSSLTKGSLTRAAEEDTGVSDPCSENIDSHILVGQGQRRGSMRTASAQLLVSETHPPSSQHQETKRTMAAPKISHGRSPSRSERKPRPLKPKSELSVPERLTLRASSLRGRSQDSNSLRQKTVDRDAGGTGPSTDVGPGMRNSGGGLPAAALSHSLPQPGWLPLSAIQPALVGGESLGYISSPQQQYRLQHQLVPWAQPNIYPGTIFQPPQLPPNPPQPQPLVFGQQSTGIRPELATNLSQLASLIQSSQKLLEVLRTWGVQSPNDSSNEVNMLSRSVPPLQPYDSQLAGFLPFHPLLPVQSWHPPQSAVNAGTPMTGFSLFSPCTVSDFSSLPMQAPYVSPITFQQSVRAQPDSKNQSQGFTIGKGDLDSGLPTSSAEANSFSRHTHTPLMQSPPTMSMVAKHAGIPSVKSDPSSRPSFSPVVDPLLSTVEFNREMPPKVTGRVHCESPGQNRKKMRKSSSSKSSSKDNGKPSWIKQKEALLNQLHKHGFRSLRLANGQVACSLCGKSYSRDMYLFRHATEHLGGQPFTCEVCNSKFTRADTLARHVKRTRHF